MSEDNNELESLDENSFADLDSLSDFAEFDDLTSLEGMEEFADILDPEELNDSGMDLPETEEKVLAAAMEKKVPMPEELFEDDTRNPGEDLFLDENPIMDEEPLASKVSIPDDTSSLDDLSMSEELSLDDFVAPEEELSLDNFAMPEEELLLDDPAAPDEELSLDDFNTLDEEPTLNDFSMPDEELLLDDPVAPEEGLSQDDLAMPEMELDLGDTALLDEELDLGDTALLADEMEFDDMPLPEEEGFSGQEDITELEDADLDDDFMLDSLLAEEDDLASLDRMLALDGDSTEVDTVEEIEAEPELDIMPEAEEVPMPEAASETDEMSELDAILEADEMSELDAIPEPDEIPELDAVPEPDEMSELDAIPEPDEMSELDAIPEPDVIPESEEVSMDTDSMSDTETVSTEDTDLDSMLDGILDDLDMGGSVSDGAATASSVDDNDDELFGLLGETDLDQAEDLMDIDLPESETNQKEEKEPGLLKRLFGNVVTDEIAEAERQEIEEEKVRAEEQAELDAKAKEEKEAVKAAKAEEKAAAKAAKAEEKAKKKEEKARLKAEKKARKKEEAEAEEQYEVTGKLNKIGVAIIAAFTLIFLTTEIAGTNLYSSFRAKKTANSYFELGKYTEAYQEILGTNLQKKDPDTYNKIKTVMQVQRSINAYNNYNEMNYYPEALNALLRGLQRYNANVENAKKYDALSDLDQCKVQITGLLQSEFGISESEADALLSLEKEQYTKRVVELAMARR